MGMRHGNTRDPEHPATRPGRRYLCGPGCSAPSATAACAASPAPTPTARSPTPTTGARMTPASAPTRPPTPITAPSGSAKTTSWPRTAAFFAAVGVRPRPGHHAQSQLPATAADPGRPRRPGPHPATKARQDRHRRGRLVTELETPADPGDPAGQALRDRVRARLTELYTERATLNTRLAALTPPPPTLDPTLLDELPILGDILTNAPAAHRAAPGRFDVHAVYNRESTSSPSTPPSPTPPPTPSAAPHRPPHHPPQPATTPHQQAFSHSPHTAMVCPLAPSGMRVRLPGGGTPEVWEAPGVRARWAPGMERVIGAGRDPLLASAEGVWGILPPASPVASPQLGRARGAALASVVRGLAQPLRPPSDVVKTILFVKAFAAGGVGGSRGGMGQARGRGRGGVRGGIGQARERGRWVVVKSRGGGRVRSRRTAQWRHGPTILQPHLPAGLRREHRRYRCRRGDARELPRVRLLVIYQRALPDARDGLKPVQRRILHQMTQMGLRPDRGTSSVPVSSAR